MIQLVTMLFCLIPVAVLASWDACEYILPNFLTYGVILSGAITAAATGRLTDALLGAVFAGSIFFIACLLGGTGGGDLRMATGLGIWFGWYPVAYIIAAGCVLGLLVGAIKIGRSGTIKTLKDMQKVFTQHNLQKEAPNVIPLGLCLGIAAWGYYMWITPTLLWLWLAVGIGVAGATVMFLEKRKYARSGNSGMPLRTTIEEDS